MTDQEFRVGDRVKIRDDAVDGYLSSFARKIRGKTATVLELPSAGQGGMRDIFRSKMRVRFDVKRKGARQVTEWMSARDFELVERPEVTP